MAEQDYSKDLYLLFVGSADISYKAAVDVLEDYVWGDLPMEAIREVKLLVPYLENMGKGLGNLLNEWAVGDNRQKPTYEIHAFVEGDAGHRSIASACKSEQFAPDDDVYVHKSPAVEAAMNTLVEAQKNGHEVAVVVLYDPEKDVELVGEFKNYVSVNTFNLCEGLIDSFPGFKTTDEQLDEERKREEFATKEAIRIAAEKEQEALENPKPAKKAATPRKRAVKAVSAPEEKPLKDESMTVVEETPRTVEELQAEASVGDKLVVGGLEFTKHSESPFEKQKLPEGTKLQEVPDVWSDVSQAQAKVDSGVKPDMVSVRRENLASLGEGIKEMAEAFAKTIDALTKMVEDK